MTFLPSFFSSSFLVCPLPYSWRSVVSMGTRLLCFSALLLYCEAATLVFYTDSSCQTVQPQSYSPNAVSAYSDVCTDLNGNYGLALSSCAAGVSATATVSYVNVYPRPAGPPRRSPPSLIILGTLSAAQGVCTLITSSSISSITGSATYFKFTDTTCSSPSNLVYATSPISNTTCYETYPPYFFLTTSDGSCRSLPSQSRYFSASPASAGVSLSFSGYGGSSCAVTAISFPNVALDQSCSVSTDNSWGVLATRPLPYTAPSPSNSPAPYSPPRAERSIVALVNNASYGGCVSGLGQYGLRFFNGVCTALGDSDIAVTSCTVGGAVSISVFNGSYPTKTSGTCTGPLTFSGTLSYGSCSTFVDPVSGEKSYLTLLSPPTCYVYTSTSATNIRQYFTSDGVCSGGSSAYTIESDTGGPGSCVIQSFERSTLPFNYSSRLVGGLFYVDAFASTAAPYACSSAGGYTVTCTAVRRDGSCVPCAYSYGDYSFGFQILPAANYVPSGISQSQTPSSLPTASRTPSTPASKSATPTPTRTTSRTASSSPTTSSTTTLTSSSTSSPTASLSVGASPSITPTETPSPSNTPSSDPTPSPSETPTPSSDPTSSPSETPTPSSSASVTVTSGDGGGGAAAASSSVAASVGGAVGGLVLLAGVGGCVALYLSSTRKGRGVVSSQYSKTVPTPSVVVLNPTASLNTGTLDHRHAPPQSGSLPPGWSRHDDGSDVWYSDPSGKTQWTHPLSGV